VIEELLAVGAPVSAHWIADRQSAPMLLRYGTEAQKELFLPGICRGESFFCIGMSEPGSGSDLASITTRARRNPNGWVLNGRKIWTTNAHRSHFMITLARTEEKTTERHRGMSQFIVDLKKPGIDIRPVALRRFLLRACQGDHKMLSSQKATWSVVKVQAGHRLRPSSPTSAAGPNAF